MNRLYPQPTPCLPRRRLVVGAALACAALPLLAAEAAPAADPFLGDPFRSHQWSELRKEFLGGLAAKLEFDPRVQVRGPLVADDAMNVPISVSVAGLADVEQIVVLVDRNPIRKVLEYEPQAGARPAFSFRFKLEQASPVRAAARTRDGVWHVGGLLVDSAGGGCTVAGVTRKDGSWPETLGQVSGRLFETFDDVGARLRLRVMHPMDTGLVAGIPAFYLKRVAVADGNGVELLRLATFEPVSENPVFSFDLVGRPRGPLSVRGIDNNGNRIAAVL